MTEPEEMLAWINRRITSAQMWLRDHGRRAKHPRPEHEITIKEYDVAMFHEVRDAYLKALERRQARAEQGRAS